MNNWQTFYKVRTELFEFKKSIFRKAPFFNWLISKIEKENFVPAGNFDKKSEIKEWSINFIDIDFYGWAAPEFKKSPTFELKLRLSQFIYDYDEFQERRFKINDIPGKFLDCEDSDKWEKWWEKSKENYNKKLLEEIEALNKLILR